MILLKCGRLHCIFTSNSPVDVSERNNGWMSVNNKFVFILNSSTWEKNKFGGTIMLSVQIYNKAHGFENISIHSHLCKT